MDRSAALTYLQNEYSALVVQTGIINTDAATGFKQVIDNALRELGYAASALTTANTTEAQDRDYVLLLDYFGLKHFMKLLSPSAFSVTRTSGQQSITTDSGNFKLLLREYLFQLMSLGYLGGS